MAGSIVIVLRTVFHTTVGGSKARMLGEVVGDGWRELHVRSKYKFSPTEVCLRWHRPPAPNDASRGVEWVVVGGKRMFVPCGAKASST
jgi:hypothetical protein